ncbi:MAG: hypothetical protein Q8P95_04985, partial [bacterium]|nr:hypothetical protein [bacterium]
KGYGFKEFKDKLLPLKNLPATLKDRIKLTTYNIVKPPYLNEVRSVQLAVKMVEDIHNFSKNELGMTIEVKHEPTVISDGSQEALLHSQRTPEGKRRFEVLSYFSVAELLAQLIEKKLNHLSKFGQRDDMDSFRDVSMIVSLLAENMFSPFDFMVYNAIQRYNTTRDVKGFLLDIRIPILRSEEFQIWEQSFCGKENSALSRLVRDEFFTQSGDPRPLTEAEQKREGFQVNLWHILNNIEYNAEISGHIRSHGKPSTEWFQQKARETFEQGGINVLFVRNPIFVDNGKGDPNIPLLSGADVHPSYRGNPKAEKEEDRLPATERATYQVEVIVTNETGDPQSLWMIVPLKTVEAPKVNISEPLGRNRLRSPAASSAEMARV